MSPIPILPAERARHLRALRGAVVYQSRTLSTLLAGLANVYAGHPGDCGLLAYLGTHAEAVRHDLAVLVTAERHIAEAA